MLGGHCHARVYQREPKYQGITNLLIYCFLICNVLAISFFHWTDEKTFICAPRSITTFKPLIYVHLNILYCLVMCIGVGLHVPSTLYTARCMFYYPMDPRIYQRIKQGISTPTVYSDRVLKCMSFKRSFTFPSAYMYYIFHHCNGTAI